ncbi:CENP-B N-terminal DNA-binding domain [Popillia japonica]|uniref:CENP-B N-terminal DNA-binding domain n=1 Tax=Popillia japonica TaxID=7064 RepID=A0AAW1JF93_POPJA
MAPPVRAILVKMSLKRHSSANLRKYKTYSSDSLAKALDSVKNEGMSVKRASEYYDINRSTLINHLKNCKCGPVGRPTILTQEEEQANAIGGFSDAGIYPLNKEKILEKAIESTVFDEAPPADSNPVTDKLTSTRSCRLNRVSDTNTNIPVSSTASAEPFSPEQLEAYILSVLQRQQNLLLQVKELRKTTQVTARTSEIEDSEEASDGSLVLETDTLTETFSDMESLEATEVENKENDTGNQDNSKVTVGAWVLVKFKRMKDSDRLVHYIGQITEIVECSEEILVNFLRRKEKCFIFPENKDESILPIDDVARVLPEPYIRRGMHTFNCSLCCTVTMFLMFLLLFIS